VLERAPERLLTIPGMGRGRAVAIARAWHEQSALKALMGFLQEQGLPAALALRIVRRYGDAAGRVVRAEPYGLIEEVFGVTFALADQLAMRTGLAADAPARLQAANKHVLHEAGEQGHTWVRQDELIAAATRLLGLPPERVAGTLPGMVREGQIASEPAADGTPAVYLGALYQAELFVAGALRALRAGPQDRLGDFAKVDWRRALDYLRAQEPELAARLDPVEGGRRLANYLRTLTLETQTLARACGKSHVHNLEPEDLVALTIEAAAMAHVPLAGTHWIPGLV